MFFFSFQIYVNLCVKQRVSVHTCLCAGVCICACFNWSLTSATIIPYGLLHITDTFKKRPIIYTRVMKILIHLAYYSNFNSDLFELSPQQTWKSFSLLSILHAYPSSEGAYHNFGTQTFCLSTYCRFMYRCAGWFALTLVCLPWKKQQ